MKVECKLHNYADKDWSKGEDAVVVRRPFSAPDMVEIEFDGKVFEVAASEMIDAINSCSER